jgi:hypothetical protein
MVCFERQVLSTTSGDGKAIGGSNETTGFPAGFSCAT